MASVIIRKQDFDMRSVINRPMRSLWLTKNGTNTRYAFHKEVFAERVAALEADGWTVMEPQPKSALGN
jgi:hypothetical protein